MHINTLLHTRLCGTVTLLSRVKQVIWHPVVACRTNCVPQTRALPVLQLSLCPHEDALCSRNRLTPAKVFSYRGPLQGSQHTSCSSTANESFPRSATVCVKQIALCSIILKMTHAQLFVKYLEILFDTFGNISFCFSIYLQLDNCQIIIENALHIFNQSVIMILALKYHNYYIPTK